MPLPKIGLLQISIRSLFASNRPLMKIVLYQPQIPQNTGTIARTCAAPGTGLILVKPLGFSTNSRHLKRAGLDYWNRVEMEEIDQLEPLLVDAPFAFFSAKASIPYTEARYSADSLLIFGSETEGLPSHFKEKWPDRFFTIPMLGQHRCLNLASSAAIVLYEAWRQNHFAFPKSRERSSVSGTLMRTEVAMGK
jgi:tRNA (cytidine/uridine-2'-O-)-methyltransferase